MKFNKFKWTILALFIGVFALMACSCGQEEPKLRVGMELAYPPFEMTDKEGRPAGIAVDLAYDLGQYLGKEVVIENMAFAGLIPALQSGKIDIVISSMTITEERLKSIDFSDPYAMANLALLAHKDSPINSFHDLNAAGRKLAVKRGTVGHLYAAKHLPNCEIMVFDKESSCVLEVVQGKADAFVYDQMTIYRNWQQHLSETRALLQPFQEVPNYWAIGLRKDDLQLKEQINEFLAQYRKDGGFDRLGEKYLAEQKKTFAELGIPFFFDIQ